MWTTARGAERLAKATARTSMRCMSSPRQANDLVNGVGVSGGGCNKLIGGSTASPFGVRQKAIRGRWQRTISKHLGPATRPAPTYSAAHASRRPMDATIIVERLAGFDLLVFCGVVDPFRVVPDVLLVNANSAKSS